MIQTYQKAYTEILEILKYLPKEEYDKIPEEKLLFFENNKDNNYIYNFDVTKPLNEQISRKTNAIIVCLFRDFFSTQTQKEKLKKLLLNNQQKHDEQLSNSYQDIFAKHNEKKEISKVKDENISQTSLVKYKQPIFKKILNKIKKYLD